MTQYRFHLQKYNGGSSKLSCPRCDKPKCFVKYVDDEGKITFPDHVGRCDHEDTCGYHYTPKDFFRDNPDMKPDKCGDDDWKTTKTDKAVISSTAKVVSVSPSYIPDDLMKKTLSHYDINPLYQFLCNSLGKEKTDKQFERYQVGTAKKWGGATVFWQIDIEGRVRAGKMMGYNSKDGHRIKEPQPQVSWVHSEMKMQDYNLKQCLFGEHLLVTSAATVMLVESEKSCLIASSFMPEFLWLATGGKNGCFNEDAMQVLRGRNVILMPDLGATEKWREKSGILRPVCQSVIVSDALEQMATDEQRGQGLDIADFLLMRETKQMILQRMIERNPVVRLLIETFGLELVEDDT